MGSVLASNVVDHGFETASLLNTQLKGVKAKIAWLGIGIMCPSVATCLPMDWCFSELAL
jgi:hypothetical protein